jgi:hypothetical protein
MTNRDETVMVEEAENSEIPSVVRESPYDFKKMYDGEVGRFDSERARVQIHVPLVDGTEESFYIPEKVLAKAGWYPGMLTPGTKIGVYLGLNSGGRAMIARVKQNKLPERPNANTLPWFRGKFKFNNPAFDYAFITVTEVPNPWMSQSSDTHVTRRTLRLYGFENFVQDDPVDVRIIPTGLGLSVIQLRKPVAEDIPEATEQSENSLNIGTDAA